jgi:Predicted integral membrane protein (DUF2269)
MSFLSPYVILVSARTWREFLFHCQGGPHCERRGAVRHRTRNRFLQMGHRPHRERSSDPGGVREGRSGGLAVYTSRDRDSSINGSDTRQIVGLPNVAWVAGLVIALFVLAGCCWIPVVWLQIRMRNLVRMSEQEGVRVPANYRVYARLWFWLGVPAFSAVVLVFWLMVAKPGL